MSPVTVRRIDIATPQTKSRLHLEGAVSEIAYSTHAETASALGTARQQPRPPAPWPCIAPSSERWREHHELQKNSDQQPEHSRVLVESACETECPRICHPADTAIWCLCRRDVLRSELRTIRSGHRTVSRPVHLRA